MTGETEREAMHLQFMLESVELALSYVDGFARDDFIADKRTQQADILNLPHLGEAANRLIADAPDIVQRHRSFLGFRCAA